MSIEELIFFRNKEKILDTLKAAAECRYFRKIFCEYNIDVTKIENYEQFCQIPIMEKEDYKKNLIDCVKDGVVNDNIKKKINSKQLSYAQKDQLLNPYNLYIFITSGSTGLPLEIVRHGIDIKKNYIAINRYRRIHGNVQALTNYIWVLPESIVSRKYVFSARDKIFRDSKYGFIACFDNISNRALNDFISFCEAKKIKTIIAWPTFLVRLAEYVTQKKITLRYLEYLESNSEQLTKKQYEFLLRVFQVPISNIYSGNETNFIGATCNNNSMHLIDDNVFLELVTNEWGFKEVIVTNLNSSYSSLIRYNLGDIAEWDIDECCCECCKQYPYKIKLSMFRKNDMIISKDGSRFEFNIIADLLNFFQIRKNVDIGQYKVIQYKEDKFVLQYSTYISQKVIDEMILYIKKQLENILNYPIQLTVVHNEFNWNEFNFCGKYRFFECRVEK